MTVSHFAHRWAADLAGAIGHTPLIRLRRASEATGCTILGKAEFMNPGGSVKDRAGLAIITDAERRGTLKPGGTVVEGTAGNTGIGLTLVGNARGYRSIIVMPETQSQEKIDFLRMIGADLRLVPAKPFKDPGNYVHVSRRMAEEMQADPEGSGLYGWVKNNDLTVTGSSITEGIGQSRVPDNLAGAPIDDAERIPDPEALEQISDVLIPEGLSVGTSAGVNIAAAIRVAKAMGPGHTIVTVLCDGGSRYQSKLFNPEFLRSKDLPVPAWMA